MVIAAIAASRIRPRPVGSPRRAAETPGG